MAKQKRSAEQRRRRLRYTDTSDRPIRVIVDPRENGDGMRAACRWVRGVWDNELGHRVADFDFGLFHRRGDCARALDRMVF